MRRQAVRNLVSWRNFCILTLAFAATHSCKQRRRDSSASISQFDKNAVQQEEIPDVRQKCQQDPAKCGAYYMASIGGLPPISCMQLWQSLGEKVIAFDEHNNIYQRVRDPKTGILRDQDYTPDNYTKQIRLGVNDISAFSGYSLPGLATAGRFGAYMKKFGVTNSRSRINWQSFPLGVKKGYFEGIALVPTFYAAKVENGVLGREEWLIFRPTFSALEESFFGDNTAQKVASAVASICIPVTSFPVDGNISIHESVRVLNEGKSIAAEVKAWESLHGGMVKFVSNAPGTGQIATIYNGCKLADKACAHALLLATADTALLVFLSPAKPASGVYYAFMAVGAIANGAVAGQHINEAIAAYKAGNEWEAVKSAGLATFRFTATSGIMIETIKGSQALEDVAIPIIKATAR